MPAKSPSQNKEPSIKLESKGTALVKASLHAELQKFGENPNQVSSKELVDKEIKKEIVKHKIEVVGIDHTQAQNQALFAIQKLMNDTNYRGNLKGHHLERDNWFGYSEYLPTFQFTPAQYLEAYGVGKHKSARGKYEFNVNERTEALQALVDLAIKPNLLIYRKIYWTTNKKGQKEERVQRIEAIAPLIHIFRGWEALTKKEDQILDQRKSSPETDEKLKFIAIEPCPILVDQIDSYFVLKPANCYEEIQLLIPYRRLSRYVYRFVDYLITQAELHRRNNEGWVIKINHKLLAAKLRMDSWLKAKQWKQIRGSLNKSYGIAKELGYLLDYKTTRVSGKEIEEFTLNSEKFNKLKELEEKRKIIEHKQNEQEATS